MHPAPFPAPPIVVSSGTASDSTNEDANSENAPVTTQMPGMTTAVVRGSVWALGGQAAMLAAALLATPFVTRILGTQAYGVWVLINVIIGTVAFADAGMSTASTKFAAEAYAQNDLRRERAVLWSSLLISGIPTWLLALGILCGAPWIVERFFGQLPIAQHDGAIIALRWAALGFALRPIGHIFNSPLLARLRLDWNTLIMAGGNVLQVLSVPLALWLGGLPWGAAALVLNAALTAVAQLWASSRFVPDCWKPLFSRDLFKPLVRFGGPALVAALANQVLANAERLMLPHYISVEALAFYGIAFTAAGILGIVPLALSQALLPAFIRLASAPDNGQLQQLVTRSLRGVLFAVLPVAMLMCVVARPFFAVWVGPQFAQNSTTPFYWLILSVVINIWAFVPTTLLLARGRTDFAAIVALCEVVPFLIYTAWLTQNFGLLGAAWSRDVRVVLVCAISFPIARRLCGVRFSPGIAHKMAFLFAVIALALPLWLAISRIMSGAATFLAAAVGVGIYAFLIYKQVLADDERAWLRTQQSALQRRLVARRRASV